MKIIDEFKEFIAKGSAMDMAVGVVVGGAFTAIVNSLVEDIINPFIAFLGSLATKGATAVGGGEMVKEAAGIEEMVIPGTTIAIGSFIGAVINFLLISFVIFCVVKAINTMKDKMIKKEEPAPEEPAGPTQEELLVEIRDLLKKQNK